MAHFASYNTSNAITGNKLLKANAVIILGPLQADFAQMVSGTVISDVAGKLFIEQSFDYNWEWKEGWERTPGGKSEAEAEEASANWDLSEEIAVGVKTAVGYTKSVLAPVVRIRYVNGAAEQKEYLRIFARTFTSGR